MAIKFAFSDEYGVYIPKRTDEQNRIHPYYSRALFIINGDDYKKLVEDFKSLKVKYNLPDEEIKWAHIWALRSSQKGNKQINPKRDHYFLKEIDYHIILDFVEEVLSLLVNLNDCKTIFTITNNNTNTKSSEKDMFKMHITTLLQRTQFETQAQLNDLAVIFFDPLCDKKSKMLREIYFEIQKNGDFIENYTHIKDSINLEFSHHSIGIQIADYLAGVMVGVLKGYDRSIKIFENSVRPTLRNYNKKILGAGICEIPTNKFERDKLRSHFKKHFN